MGRELPFGRVLDQLETPSEADARPQVERYEQSMNRMAIITGAVSATGLIGGLVLLGVGLRGRKTERRTTLTPTACRAMARPESPPLS